MELLEIVRNLNIDRVAPRLFHMRRAREVALRERAERDVIYISSRAELTKRHASSLNEGRRGEVAHGARRHDDIEGSTRKQLAAPQIQPHIMNLLRERPYDVVRVHASQPVLGLEGCV